MLEIQVDKGSFIYTTNILDNWEKLINNFNELVARKSGQSELKSEDSRPKKDIKRITNPTKFDITLKGLLILSQPMKK